jgi:hypothetical protein
MRTWTITFIVITLLVFILWVILMKMIKPSRIYHDETRWEANRREGGFKVLLAFLILGFFASVGVARIILWFMYLER